MRVLNADYLSNLGFWWPESAVMGGAIFGVIFHLISSQGFIPMFHAQVSSNMVLPSVVGSCLSPIM
jgi:hypothetical protein